MPNLLSYLASLPGVRTYIHNRRSASWQQSLDQPYDWKRTHAFHAPFNTMCLFSWITCFLVDISFFSAFLPFYEPTSSEIDYNPHVHWWLCSLGIFFAIFIKFIIIWVGLIETEDPAISAAGETRSRSYVLRAGVSVVNSLTKVCGICRVKVPKTTVHCKSCNKCVGHIDHHCKWLNCCISKANYRLFMILVITTFIGLVIYSTVGLNILWMARSRRLVYFEHVAAILGTPSLTTIHLTIMTILVIALTIVFISAAVALLRLLHVHYRLWKFNLTTITYFQNYPPSSESLSLPTLPIYLITGTNPVDDNPWRRPWPPRTLSPIYTRILSFIGLGRSKAGHDYVIVPRDIENPQSDDDADPNPFPWADPPFNETSTIRASRLEDDVEMDSSDEVEEVGFGGVGLKLKKSVDGKSGRMRML